MCLPCIWIKEQHWLSCTYSTRRAAPRLFLLSPTPIIHTDTVQSHHILFSHIKKNKDWFVNEELWLTESNCIRHFADRILQKTWSSHWTLVIFDKHVVFDWKWPSLDIFNVALSSHFSLSSCSYTSYFMQLKYCLYVLFTPTTSQWVPVHFLYCINYLDQILQSPDYISENILYTQKTLCRQDRTWFRSFFPPAILSRKLNGLH